jgi:hypothetical protein
MKASPIAPAANAFNLSKWIPSELRVGFPKRTDLPSSHGWLLYLELRSRALLGACDR